MRALIPKIVPIRRRLRSGVQTLELVIAFPLLLIASLAIVQFATLSAFQSTVEAAVAEAAREAAKTIDPLDAPQAAQVTFNRAMFLHGITTSTPKIALAIDQVGSHTVYGDPTMALLPGAVIGNEVRVTAAVSLRSAPTLNLLKTFGLDFDQRTIETTHVSGA
ncbi:pilus assembly protein [Blastopirellula sp. J2-11]|uniref:TadE/TadG family type IV pilus assembly protein n=1 Tax=Blastopirellula sp. J2-11 TaxID=2943192 RepID=UPI0021C7CAC2|nr:TadE/TadG family type IV pilus assembly protein [Blastopirellula sp. J2-11]UUO07966.1 pilus assembly protein [Blastopirellula sp. J2-11]